MRLAEIINKTKWNQCFSSFEQSQFLQSWEWGEFQKAMGRKVWRLGIEERGKLIDGAQVIKYNLPLGRSYLYIPRAVISHERLVIREIKRIARREKSIFFKIEPVKENLIPRDLFLMTRPIQPQATLLLDLSYSEQELLANMHQKTRYNIRLAKKRGVKIQRWTPVSEGRDKFFEDFWQLIEQTSKRDGFRSHSKMYYRKMLEVLGSNQVTKEITHCSLFIAKYQDKIISANIVIFFGNTTSYIHGASGDEHRNIMAPHLLQWEQIKFAKKQGYRWYDFWGINPSHKAIKPYSHRASWQGITRFKRGFVSDKTGKEVGYPGCYDLILRSTWYKFYKIFKTLKR